MIVTILLQLFSKTYKHILKDAQQIGVYMYTFID